MGGWLAARLTGGQPDQISPEVRLASHPAGDSGVEGRSGGPSARNIAHQIQALDSRLQRIEVVLAELVSEVGRIGALPGGGSEGPGTPAPISDQAKLEKELAYYKTWCARLLPFCEQQVEAAKSAQPYDDSRVVMEEKIRDGIRRRSEELDRITTLAALEDWLRRASAFRSVRQSYLYYHPEFRDSE